MDIAPFATLLRMVGVVAKAAAQPAGVKPTALREAFSLVTADPLGKKIAEGLKASGVGQALDLDARHLLAAGELDEECDEEFADSMSAIFGLPIQVEDDFSKVSLQAEFMQKGGERWMKSIGENLSVIAVVIAKWSPSRMSDEVEAFCECLVQVGVVMQAYDRTRMHQVFKKYGDALKKWDNSLEDYTEDSHWPPEDLKEFANPDCGLDDEAINAHSPLDSVWGGGGGALPSDLRQRKLCPRPNCDLCSDLDRTPPDIVGAIPEPRVQKKGYPKVGDQALFRGALMVITCRCFRVGIDLNVGFMGHPPKRSAPTMPTM